MAQFPTPAHPSLDSVPTSSEVRQIYPRDFFPNPNSVRLPLGKTTYWILGPEDGPKVVLIHGISIPSLLWKYIGPFLAEKGFRVLIYDLFGRGYSEAPDTTYNADLYTTQLALLLQHVQFEHAHIVGLSMGGGIAAAFAATFPNLVTEKIVFIASVGLTEALPSVSQSAKVPLMRKLQTECLSGYAHAVSSSYTDGPLKGLQNAFLMIAGMPRLKSLIIHGTKDRVVNFSNGEKIKALVPSAVLVPIEGADHDLTVAEAYYAQVQEAILKFFQG
ncbi:alpha/beta-hydrolase [Ramaria rubella]|nr:alpha/beta-hydrolase [Ramaria rubella]